MTSTAAAGDAAAGAEEPAHAALTLDVSIVVANDLSEPSRHALMAEASRIWKAAGVQLRWAFARRAVPPPDTALRVLVIPRQPSATRDTRWVVGELLPLTGKRALALASIAGARRVLAEARTHQSSEFPLSDEVGLGVVLGRAVAHEIGHFLLDTRTHAHRGLMRAGFDAREFADPRALDTFALDAAARRFLQQHHSRPRAAGQARAAGAASALWPPFSGFSSGRFSYAKR